MGLAASASIARQGGSGEARREGSSRESAIHRASYQRGRSGQNLTCRWIGQDGHDYVSHSDRHEPNERQDIHLALGGLDPEREIAFIDISVPDGHRWQYNTAPGYWKIELQRRKGATVADLFVEPEHRDGGAVWHVLVRYDDNSTAEADVRSRKADPFLRVPSLSVQARWIGQDRLDLTGLGTGVGPDGLQDVRLHLTGLSQKLGVKAIRVEMAGGIALGVRGEFPAPQPRRTRQGREGPPPGRLLPSARPRADGAAAQAEASCTTTAARTGRSSRPADAIPISGCPRVRCRRSRSWR